MKKYKIQNRSQKNSQSCVPLSGAKPNYSKNRGPSLHPLIPKREGFSCGVGCFLIDVSDIFLIKSLAQIILHCFHCTV